jgi:hypothetical protein
MIGCPHAWHFPSIVTIGLRRIFSAAIVSFVRMAVTSKSLSRFYSALWRAGEPLRIAKNRGN